MNAVPGWIEGLDAFQRRPPYYGLGTVDLHNRPVIGFDTETYKWPTKGLVTDGGKKKEYPRRKVPRMVCATFAGRGRNTPVPVGIIAAERAGHAKIWRYENSWKAIVDRVGSEPVFTHLLSDPTTVLVAHNTAFDLAVIAESYPALLPHIFQALADSRITDTMIREMLIKIAYGQMQDDDQAGRNRFDLASMAKEYNLGDRTGQKKGEDIWRLRYHELDGLPFDAWPEAAIEYALDDAVDALMILILQAPLGKERRSEKFLPVSTVQGGIINEVPQIRSAWALHLMGCWGLRTDPVLYERWGGDIAKAVDYARAVGRKAGFIRPNNKLDKRRLQELVAVDFKARGKEYPLTDTGVETQAKTGERPDDLKYVSTAKETLIECSRLEVEYEGQRVAAVKLWGETAFMLRMRSTYYDPAGLGRDNAMLYDFNVLVATGRTSARNPNMQNPPRDGMFRELFVARPGMVFCSVDYAAEELRTLGQLHYWWFGESALRDAFLRGDDPHVMFGAMLAGVDFKTFKTWKHHPDTSFRKRYKELRQAAKAANFGYPGGLGPDKFIAYAWDTYRVDLAAVAVLVGFANRLPDEGTEARHDLAIRYAKQLKTQWLQQWLEADRYMKLIASEVRNSDTFTYIQPVSWRQRGGCFYTSGNNTGFQGLAADAAKEALWRLAILCYLTPEDSVRMLKAMAWVPTGRENTLPDATAFVHWAQALFGVRPVLFVHDEIIAEGPTETAHVWGVAQAEVMAACAQVYTPDVPQEAEETLMPRWYKKAERVYADDKGLLYIKGKPPGGRLAPWEPDQDYADDPKQKKAA